MTGVIASVSYQKRLNCTLKIKVNQVFLVSLCTSSHYLVHVNSLFSTHVKQSSSFVLQTFLLNCSCSSSIKHHLITDVHEYYSKYAYTISTSLTDLNFSIGTRTYILHYESSCHLLFQNWIIPAFLLVYLACIYISWI